MSTVNATTTASILTWEYMSPIVHGLLDYALTCTGPDTTAVDKVEGLRAQYLAQQLSDGCIIFHNFLNAPTEFTTRDQQIIYAGVLAGISRCQHRGDHDILGVLYATKALLDDGLIITP